MGLCHIIHGIIWELGRRNIMDIFSWILFIMISGNIFFAILNRNIDAIFGWGAAGIILALYK